MFCFHCGKTIPENQTTCPHCSAEVGQNRFYGMPYTSAQPRFEADAQANHAQSLGYTRTTYTDMKEDEGETDARTTYRPAYNTSVVPDDMRRDMLSEMEEKEKAEEQEKHAPIPKDEQFRRTMEDLISDDLDIGEMDLSQFRTRPVQFREQAGISEDVTEYMKQLAEAKERRQNRRSALSNFKLRLPHKDSDAASEEASEETADYDDYRSEEESEERVRDASDGNASDESGENDENAPAEYDSEGDAEGYEDEEDEDEGREGNAVMRLKRFLPDIPKAIRIAVVLVLAAALVFGLVTWIRYISKKSVRAPIEGVTLEYYNAGIEMIEKNAAQERIDSLIATYNSEGLVSMNAALSADAIALTGLAPTTPNTNDALFGQALSAIETNIGNALTMDVLTMGSGSDDSAERWNVVNNSIAQLKSATSAGELTAIINGQKISAAPTPTPMPTPAPYKVLSNGDKSDAVLDLQNRLYELGFFADERDGAYGNKTMTAVKLFQEAAKLPVTGIADVATQEALYASDAPKGNIAN